MTLAADVLRRLARESGLLLGELGVLPEDREWIDKHVQTLTSLQGGRDPRRWRGLLYRLARKAARTAR